MNRLKNYFEDTGYVKSTVLNFHETIWRKYAGWIRTVTSTIPTEEVVKSVIQQEYYHNFRVFKGTAIYRIIMSMSKKTSIGSITSGCLLSLNYGLTS